MFGSFTGVFHPICNAPMLGAHPSIERTATGKPAFTGVVQATAIAPTALEAETRAKAAVLSGPDVAAAWLPDGGVLVFEDAGHRVVEPASAATRQDD